MHIMNVMDRQIQQRLDVLSTRPYRAKFRLLEPERSMVAHKGNAVIRQHAFDLIGTRLAPAHPRKDGKQTPYRGHPVFVAQHASATCCRGCLARWHHIPKGHELTRAEQDYAAQVIDTWITRQMSGQATELWYPKS